MRDAFCLLLDVLIRTLRWPLACVSSLWLRLHAGLFALCSSDFAKYGDLAVFSFLAAAEVFSGAVRGASGAVEAWLQTLGGVLESAKMMGHLLCHVAWRAKDLLQRGVLLGAGLLRQTYHAVCIALSLAVYLVNTAVNVVLIATQNCVAALAGAWEAVAAPAHKAAELTLTALTFLYSCLGGVSVLLWAPCQLLLDLAASLGRVAFAALTADSYVLAAAMVTSLGFLMLNPRLQILAGRPRFCVVHALRRVRAAVQRVYAAVREPSFRAVYGRTAPTDPSPTAEARPPASAEPRAETGGGRTRPPPPAGALKRTDAELLRLLKEQEERKKCVICQDASKTVLLLPCRHLCLCRRCTTILIRRQQRLCPLCRRHITQTMEVFL